MYRRQGAIHNAGDSLLHIINDILDLSKIESGKLELTPLRYEVASLINDAVQLNIMWAASKPVTLTLQVDENTPSSLIGDEMRIMQILNNLLSNAFKYTERGTVALSVNAEVQREQENEMTLVLRVSDTGMGMTEEEVRTLFDEYRRFNLESNRAVEGTGLGMSIVRNLIDMMDGEVFVESEPGSGTTFTVRLPQGSVGPDVIGRDLAENLRQLRPYSPTQIKRAQISYEPMPYGSVLIVDDLEMNLYVAKGLMAPYGLTIDTALSGYEAIEKIKDGKEYDIVFMDHFMPDLDGLETVQILRDQGYTSPIVALSANAVAEQSKMFLEHGFDAFISKPIDTRRLDMLLNKLIYGKQPPLVIEAARRQKESGEKAVDGAPPSSLGPQLAEVFSWDATRAITTLEPIHANEYRRSNDVHLFVITVHAMKSALANIGEAELSALAGTLEKAGSNGDTDTLLANTPVFLNALRALVEKLRPEKKDEDSELVDEDRAYLRENLLVIQTACQTYDKRAAKDALLALRQKAWTRQTKEQLDAIDIYLLHSDFEEAAATAEALLL